MRPRFLPAIPGYYALTRWPVTALANAGGIVRGLVAIGLVLVVLWVLGLVVFKVAGFMIHLLLILGAIMLIMGLVNRVRGGTPTSGTRL